jgi:hypothetical protein
MNLLLNYNLFTPGQPLQPETLVAVEQIPGYIYANDVTPFLVNESYFGSCEQRAGCYIGSFSHVLACRQHCL